MNTKLFKKLVSFFLSLSLLANSVSAPLLVLAQETPTPDPTPTPVAEETATPTPEPTLAPTDEPTLVPEVSPTPDATVAPEETATPTPVVEEVLPAQTENTESPSEPTNESAQSQAPPAESASPESTITSVQPTTEGELSTTLVQEGSSYSIDVLSYDGYTVTTDKLDYAPTDTAIVTGTNFTAGETYSLTVSSTDEPAISTTVSVTADANGEFVYAYELDGIYRPNYSVEVKSGETVVASTTFTDSHIASHECTNDLQGVNDEPGQKDLTKMCVDETGLNTSIAADWNWDDTGWSGANTGDACALFDTDGDGFANFASCVTVEHDPATQKSTSPRIFTCNDTRNDRCAGPGLVAGPYTSSCSVSITTDQPFATGDDTPNDTHAACTVQMSEVGGAGVAELIDVCSFPSDNPNSDPSDCIVFEPGTGRLEIVKDLIPAEDTGLFNLQINGSTEAPNVGDGGSTGEKIYEVANNGTVFTVGETAGTGTDLSDYSTSIECKDVNGTGSVVFSSSDSGPLDVTLNEDDDIVCTITNTLQNGTIVVHKDVQGPVGEDIFDDSQDFTVQLDDAGSQLITDGGTVTYNDVVAGPHKITESVIPAGYVLYSITPDSDGGTTGAQVTVVANQTTDVYVVNRIEAQPELGTLKTLTSATTALEGDTVTFQIQVENTGNVTLYNPVIYDIYDADYLLYVSSSPISETTHSAAVADASDYDGDGDTTELIRTLSWVLPADLDPGDTYTITLTFTALQFTDDDPVTTYTGNEAWTESCLSDSQECTEEDIITTEPSPADVDIDALGSVSGYKFVDENGDGLWGEEGPLAGVTVNLYISDGQGGYDFVGSDVTEGDGSYGFVNLAVGDYKVCEDVPTGYAQTFPSDDGCHYFSITENGDVFEDRNFGNQGDLSIFGYKYEDANGDGVDDSDWTPVEGLLVKLWQWVVDQFVDTGETDTTDVNGYYEFLNLVPGTYQVSEDLTSLGATWTYVFPTISDDIILTDQDAQHDFVNTQYGHIIIEKNAISDSDQEFTFNNDFGNGNSSTFGLTDDSTPGLPSYDAEVLPGTYSVSENPVFGWESPESATCSDQSPISAIEVSAGETVTCTFTNEELATITLVKNTVGGDGTFDFDATGDGLPADVDLTTVSNTANQVFSDLDPDNTYTIAETAQEGWDLTSATCDNGDPVDDITPNAGEEITCTFLNTELGNVTVVKYNDHNGNGIKDEGDEVLGDTGVGPEIEATRWEIHLDEMSQFTGAQVAGQVTFSDLLPNSFTLSEQIKTGWDQTNIACGREEGIDKDNNHPVTLAAGQNLTCYIGNQGRGTIVIVKDANPNSENDFTFDTDLPGVVGGVFDLEDDGDDNNGGTEESITFNVPTGSYSVDEQDEPGWELTNLECSDENNSDTDPDGRADITLDINETVTCTYTNTQLGSVSGSKFEDLDGILGGTQNPVSGWVIELWQWIVNNWFFYDDTTTNGSGFYSFSDLLPGLYQIREGTEVGWTNMSPLVIEENLSAGELSTENDFVNTQYGSITVYKNVDFNGDGDLDDAEIDAIQAPGWTWDIDGAGNYSASFGENTVEPLLPGTYTISEDHQAGYHVLSLVCGETNYGAVQSQEISLSSNQDLICTFTNSRDTGDLEVTKYNDLDGNGQQDPGEGVLAGWEINVQDQISQLTDVNGQAFFNSLLTGSYELSETEQTGWTQTNISCQVGDSNEAGVLEDDEYYVNIESDQTTHCLIGNQGLGTIIVEKVVEGTDAEEEFDFTISDGDELIETIGFTLGDGDSTDPDYSGLPANTYVVGEEPNELYTTTVECVSDQEDTEVATGLNLDPGETITCTFTNTRNTGTIIVHKIIDPDGNLEDDSDQFPGEGWEMDVNGNSEDTSDPAEQNTDASGETTFGDLKTGDYNVFETLQPGYDMLDAYCDEGNGSWDGGLYGVEVGAGDTVNCTFINSPNGEIHGQKWNDLNGNGVRGLFEEEPYLSGWKIFLDENDNQTWDEGEAFDITDDGEEFGWYVFEHLFPGTYTVCEEVQPGWVQTSSPQCHTVEIPTNLELGGACPGPEQQNSIFGSTCDFGNQEQADVTVTKYLDENGNGNWDDGEPTLTDWQIYLSELVDFTDENGEVLFDNIVPGEYVLYEVIQDGYIQTEISCYDGELTGEENTLNLSVGAGDSIECRIGNQPEVLDVSIEKSNNKPNTSAGDTVTYTLVVTNNGNQTIFNLDVIDVLPGGFSYISGTTTGVTTSDPTIAGSKLTWSDVDDLEPAESITLEYQVQIASDATNGTYTNFATCSGDVRGQEDPFECNEDDSTVTLGSGTSFGGNLTPQVLGASTELPATGTPTALLLLALGLLGTGLYLRKKYAN